MVDGPSPRRDTDMEFNPYISRRIRALDPDDPFHGEW